MKAIIDQTHEYPIVRHYHTGSANNVSLHLDGGFVANLALRKRRVYSIEIKTDAGELIAKYPDAMFLEYSYFAQEVPGPQGGATLQVTNNSLGFEVLD